MFDTNFLADHPLNKPAARLTWLFGLFVLAVVGLLTVTGFLLTRSIDQVSFDRQKAEVARSIEDEVGYQAAALTRRTSVPEAVVQANGASAKSWLGTFVSSEQESAGFESAFLLSKNGLLAASAGESFSDDIQAARLKIASGIVEALTRKIAQTSPEPFSNPSDFGTGQIAYDGNQALFVFAASVGHPIPHEQPALTIIGFRSITPKMLGILAYKQSIGRLMVTTRDAPAGDISLPIAGQGGREQARLVWTPYRLGHLVNSDISSMLVLMATAGLALASIIYAHIQHVASDFINSEKQARSIAGRDLLSGLSNRFLFMQRLDQELARMNRGEGSIAVLFLDLDGFKDVNDTYGHQAGDDLIKAVGRRMSDLLRGADLLARFGGDEFAIIQTGVKNASDAEALARRILDDISHPFSIAGTQIVIGVSIGIALAPENGSKHEVLMRLADTALYQAKSDGRNRYSFFEQQMDETIKLRKLVEDDLRTAIEADKLLLHYQPQMSPDGKTVLGVEALVRWPHPKRGLIPPDQFIPIAEKRGLIIPLGEWVLRRACLDGMRWPDVRVAVNVSPIQFRHKNFVPNLLSIIEETGFDPARLEIELTEGVLVEDADAAEVAIMELRAVGIHLALDDFGTGYASLIYLRRFAFDKIKIDRSFLESMEATGEGAILVHSIVHLGRALGLTVTAEGVETEEQHRFLQAVGCHELQGYLFSKPVPAEEIDRRFGVGEYAQTASAA